jgi:hypothetical protein
MKTWELNRKVNGLSNIIEDSTNTQTKIDINSTASAGTEKNRGHRSQIVAILNLSLLRQLMTR